MTRIPNVYIPNKATLPSIETDEKPETDRDRMVAFTKAFAEAQQSPAWGLVLDYMRVLGDLGINADNMGIEMLQRCVEAAEAKLQQVNKDRPPAPEPDAKQHDAVVYYMKLGNLVKIGTSRRIAQRVIAFNPERVLAVEPGAHGLETVRHHQFASLREQGEWFRYEQPIRDHISQIPARFKLGTGVEMSDWLGEHLKLCYSKRVIPYGLEQP
jgi:hypothetical protein